MNCLFVLKGSALNRGMNTGSENLAWGLAENGLTIHILCGGNEPAVHGYKIAENVHYHFTGKSGDNPIAYIPAFHEIVQAHKINAVIGWISLIAPLAAEAKDYDISFIASQGQMPPRSVVLSFIKRALLKRMGIVEALKALASIYSFPRKVKGVVSNSLTVQSASISAYRLNKDKCHVIHRGIDTSIFQFKKKRYQTDRFNVTFAGRVHEPKGLDDLVSALAFVPYPVTVTLCGNGEPVYIAAILEKLRSFNLGHDLIYAGPQSPSELLRYFHDCDIFAFPSHSEGMPKALLEAMCCGCPVVCSDILPHKEVVQDGKNGLMVPVKSPKDLANAIIRYIENPTLRELCGRNARQTIEDRFSKQRELDSWLQLLR